MAGRKGRRGWGRIRQLHNKSKRYQASYIWPPMTTDRHNAPTTFSTRALAEQWLAGERRLIERGDGAAPYPGTCTAKPPAPKPSANTRSGGSRNGP